MLMLHNYKPNKNVSAVVLDDNFTKLKITKSIYIT